MAEKEFTCPVAGTLSMIGGKYKLSLIHICSAVQIHLCVLEHVAESIWMSRAVIL